MLTTRGLLRLDGGGNPFTQIAASATGPRSGPGGNVTVAAGSLTIADGAQISSSAAGLGSGGVVDLAAADIVLGGLGSQVTALSTGAGDAGSIAISANRMLMSAGAAISTEALASTANGGSITLTLGDQIYLRNSEITASVAGLTGDGGNITIAGRFVILDRSVIIASAVAGQNGNITIHADGFVPSSDSIVSATGELDINGLVPLNGLLVALSSELHRPVALTGNSCAARAGRPQSSLVAAGRGGLLQDPDAGLPALYVAGRDLRLAPPAPPPRAETGGELPSMLRVPMRCG
jgi:large exoprotein involved in heme utilization and adhesion